MPEAEHYSIVIVDVEGSGSLRDGAKLEVRRDMYGLLRNSLHLNGVDWSACTTEDRGDGVYVLVPGSVPKRRLGEEFVRSLDRMLGERRVGDAPLRLRLALHCGEVTRDDDGSSGADVDQAFAMVDNQAVRGVLAAARSARMVVVTSDAIFRAGFCSHPDDDPTWMRRLYLRTKREELPVWVGVPGLPRPPVVDAPEEVQTEPAVAPSDGGQIYVAPVIGGDSNAPVAGHDNIAPVSGRRVRIDGNNAPQIGVPGANRQA